MNLKINSNITNSNYMDMMSDNKNYKKIDVSITYKMDYEYLTASIYELTSVFRESCNLDFLDIKNITDNLQEELLDYMIIFYINVFLTIKEYENYNGSITETYLNNEEDINAYIEDSTSTFINEIIENNSDLDKLINDISNDVDVKDKIDIIYDLIIELISYITNVPLLVDDYMDNLDFLLKDKTIIKNFRYIIPHRRYIIEGEPYYRVRQHVLICYE